LAWHADAFRRQGIRRIAAVRGYRKEAIDLGSLQYFDNDRYAETGELASLYAARDFLKGELVIAYGDIVFDDFILGNLLRQDGDISLAVDGAWKLRDRGDNRRDWVVTSGAYDPLGKTVCTLQGVGAAVKRADVGRMDRPFALEGSEDRALGDDAGRAREERSEHVADRRFARPAEPFGRSRGRSHGRPQLRPLVRPRRTKRPRARVRASVELTSMQIEAFGDILKSAASGLAPACRARTSPHSSTT